MYGLYWSNSSRRTVTIISCFHTARAHSEEATADGTAVIIRGRGWPSIPGEDDRVLAVPTSLRYDYAYGVSLSIRTPLTLCAQRGMRQEAMYIVLLYSSTMKVLPE